MEAGAQGQYKNDSICDGITWCFVLRRRLCGVAARANPLATSNELRSPTVEGLAQDKKTARREGEKWGYSRKTARGASSPAKPALHIPELPSGLALMILSHEVPFRPLQASKMAACSLVPRALLDPVRGDTRCVAREVGEGDEERGLGTAMNRRASLPIVDDESCNFFCAREK